MTSSTEINQYHALLEQVIQQLDSLIYEIEHLTLYSASNKEPVSELKFDAIPLIRKLKHAKKYAQQSHDHYG